MNAEFEAHAKELNALRQEAARLLEAVATTSALHWRPDEGTWSIAQQFDHLEIIGDLCLPPLRAGLGDLKTRNARGEGPFRYPAVERLFVSMMNPTGLRRLIPVPVPPIYEPSQQTDATAIEVAARFDALQTDLLACVTSADGYDLTAARFPSPANAAIKMSVGSWLTAFIAHERNHVSKAQNLRAHPDFPDLK